MPKGLGKALQDALNGLEKPQPVSSGSSTLLNAHRRRIFEYLCLRPFSTAGRIASDLKFSPSSVMWHLRSMEFAGYVVHRKQNNIYYPKDFVDIADSGMFTVLHSPRRRDVLGFVFYSPGVSQTEVAKEEKLSRQTAGKVLAELEKVGLATRLTDGRFARWYPTDLLREKQDAQRVRSRAYVESFIRRLEAEGQSPQVLRRTETELQLRFGHGRERGVLSVPLDPYGAAAIQQ